jgi:hypothetical protein
MPPSSVVVEHLLPQQRQPPPGSTGCKGNMAVNQGKAPNGVPALVDSDGLIYMRDRAGGIVRIPAEEFDMASTREGMRLAGEKDLGVAAAEGGDSDAPWTAFAESTAASALDVGLLGPRAAGRLGQHVGAGIAGMFADDQSKVDAVQERISSGETDLVPTGRGVVSRALNPTDDAARAEYEQRARQRAIDNPWARGTGEFVGGVVGSGGLAAPVSTLGRVALGMVGGAAFGGSSVTEQAFIENVPLTSERMAAGMGLGAVFGVGTELGLAGIGKGYRALRSKPAPTMPGVAAPAGDVAEATVRERVTFPVPLGSASARKVSEIAADLGDVAAMREGRVLVDNVKVADDFVPKPGQTVAVNPRPLTFKEKAAAKILESSGINALKTVGVGFTDAKRIARTLGMREEKIRELPQLLMGGRLADGTPIMTRGMSDAQIVKNVTRAISETVEEGIRYERLVSDFATGKSPLEYFIKRRGVQAFRQAEAEILNPMARNLAERTRYATLSELFDGYEKQFMKVPTFATLNRIKRELDRAARGGGGDTGLMRIEREGAGEMVQFARILEDQIDNGAEEVLKAMAKNPASGGHVHAAGKYAELRDRQHMLRVIAESSANPALREAFAGFGISTARMVGAVGSVGGPMSMVEMLVTAAAINLGAKRARQWWAMTGNEIASKLDSRVKEGIRYAAGTSTVKGIVPHKAKSAAAATAVAAKPKREPMPRSLAAITGQFADPGEDSRTAYIRRTREIVGMTNNAEHMAQTLAKRTEAMAPHVPVLAAHVAATQTRQLMFLASKITAGVKQSNPLNPHEITTDASAEDIARFSRYWETVNNPLTAIKALADGTLTEEHVEALKVVYPGMYADLQQQVFEMMREAKTPPPYDKRAQLDRLLSLNGAGEPSLSPAFQSTLVSASTALDQEMAESPGSGGSSGGNPSKPPKAATRYQTVGSQIETGTP